MTCSRIEVKSDDVTPVGNISHLSPSLVSDRNACVYFGVDVVLGDTFKHLLKRVTGFDDGGNDQFAPYQAQVDLGVGLE